MIKSKDTAIICTVGTGLLVCGIFIYLNELQFRSNAVRSDAEIVSVRDESVIYYGTSRLSHNIHHYHECFYTIQFRPQTTNADVETKLKTFTGTACLTEANHPSIQYNREHPDDIALYSADDDGGFAGKFVISLGVLAIGAAYFLWVARIQCNGK